MNVGQFDARVRVVLASVLFLFALLLIDALSTLASFLVLAAAIALLATGLTRLCPLYSLFRLSSCPKNTARG
jgi:hypothetical protein